MAKYYNSIDNCPILVFIQISQGKKGFETLLIDGKYDVLEAEKAWNSLYFDYIEEFGVSTEFKHYTRERLQLCEMLNAFYVKGEKWQKLLIEIKKSEIKALEAGFSTHESDFNTIVGKLSKKMGFPIDPMKTTIRQFYSYIKS